MGRNYEGLGKIQSVGCRATVQGRGVGIGFLQVTLAFYNCANCMYLQAHTGFLILGRDRGHKAPGHQQRMSTDRTSSSRVAMPKTESRRPSRIPSPIPNRIPRPSRNNPIRIPNPSSSRAIPIRLANRRATHPSNCRAKPDCSRPGLRD